MKNKLELYLEEKGTIGNFFLEKDDLYRFWMTYEIFYNAVSCESDFLSYLSGISLNITNYQRHRTGKKYPYNEMEFCFGKAGELFHNFFERKSNRHKQKITDTHLTKTKIDEKINEFYESLFAFLNVHFNDNLRFFNGVFICDKTDKMFTTKSYSEKNKDVFKICFSQREPNNKFYLDGAGKKPFKKGSSVDFEFFKNHIKNLIDPILNKYINQIKYIS